MSAMRAELARMHEGSHPREIPPDAEIFQIPDDLEMRVEDGRMSLRELYQAHDILTDRGWKKELILQQRARDENGDDTGRKIPVVCLSSPETEEKEPTLVLMGGVHGEEPAGSNAIAQEMEFIRELSEKYGIPVVVYPMVNPAGYRIDHRYHDAYRKNGTSVTDSEHHLIHLEDSTRARFLEPICPEAAIFTRFALGKMMGNSPPRLWLDHHEDEHIPGKDGRRKDKRAARPYLYTQGFMGLDDPVAHRIVGIFRELDHPLRMHGRTRFKGEKIKHGLVSVPDGSIDELAATEWIMIDGKTVRKPYARSSVVIETPTSIPLAERVNIHRRIIRAVPELWDLASQSRLYKRRVTK